MQGGGIREIKRSIYRRIGVRSVIFAIWAAGLLYEVFCDPAGSMRNYYIYATFVLFAVWVVNLIRDTRFLKNDELLSKQAVERCDERNILITYKATRIATVCLLCMCPVAICILAAMGMQDAVNTLAAVAGLFGIIYVISWIALSRVS